MLGEYIYTLYDARYLTDKDSAYVYDVCDTLEEARESKRNQFTDAIIVKEQIQVIDVKNYTVINSEIVF